MRDGVSRGAASIIAAMLAIALAVAMHFLASDSPDSTRKPWHLRSSRVQEAEASFAPETLSRPYTSSRKATPLWVGAAVK